MSEIAAHDPGTSVDRPRAMRFTLLTLLLVMVTLGGCTSTAPQAPPYEPTLPPGPCAVEGVTGSIPGVTLAIRSEECVYQVGQPARFTYEVATGAAVPAIDVPSSAGCGACVKPSTDPLSWIAWRIEGTTHGVTHTYCLCDTGCCPPDQAQTVQPAITTASDVIEWSGRNWYGPSDTSQPEGAFFPPGVYRVKVTFFGFDEGSVTAELPIEIIPDR